jgi:hypothetical protein
MQAPLKMGPRQEGFMKCMNKIAFFKMVWGTKLWGMKAIRNTKSKKVRTDYYLFKY